MKVTFAFLSALYFCASSTIVTGHDFRDPDQPGHRETIDGSKPEQLDFLNCVMIEYLKIDYVEACAIFKKNDRIYLECRYLTETYEKISTERLSHDGDEVGNICASKILGAKQSTFGENFSSLWTSILGENQLAR